MKSILFIIVFFAALSQAIGQDIANFFSTRGVADLAAFAHPDLRFVRGTFDLEHDNAIMVAINYGDNGSEAEPYSRIKIWQNTQTGSRIAFTRLETLNDNDFAPAFSSNNGLSQVIQKYQRRFSEFVLLQQEMEKYLKKQASYWSGMEWTLFLLNLDFLDYTRNLQP